jgi:hypothetical protein
MNIKACYRWWGAYFFDVLLKMKIGVFSVFLLLGCGQKLTAQAILAPPFGLHWGDTPDKILDWAQLKKLDVQIKIPGDHPEIREVRVSAINGPLPGQQAYALDAIYHWGKLFEVTVHYGAPGMDVREVKVDFEKVKKVMTVKHGEFTPNNKQEKKKDGFIRRSVSYHVEPVSGFLLLMALSEVEDTVRKKHSARFSLLYRNQNIIPKQ